MAIDYLFYLETQMSTLARIIRCLALAMSIEHRHEPHPHEEENCPHAVRIASAAVSV